MNEKYDNPNHFTIGHPEAAFGFRSAGQPSVRPFTPPTHPEMPSGGPINLQNLRRALRGSVLTSEQAEAAVWALSLLSETASRQFRTEAIRAGLL